MLLLLLKKTPLHRQLVLFRPHEADLQVNPLVYLQISRKADQLINQIMIDAMKKAEGPQVFSIHISDLVFI